MILASYRVVGLEPLAHRVFEALLSQHLQRIVMCIKTYFLGAAHWNRTSSSGFSVQRTHQLYQSGNILGRWMGIEPILLRSQHSVQTTTLPTPYNTILKHTRLPLQPCSCQFRMHLAQVQRIPLVVCTCQFRLKMHFNMAPEVGIEPTISESKSGVLPLHYSGT